MDKAQDVLNGWVSAEMQQVLLDAKAENQTATVVNALINALPKFVGQNSTQIERGIKNILENDFKLTKVSVIVQEFNDQFRIFPKFSFDNSVIAAPSALILQKQRVAVAV